MRKWLERLRNVIRPGRLDRDLERELRFHVTERTEELRETGMSAEAAARLARQQFGNFTAQVERTRDVDIADRMDAMLRNVRLARRALAKSPGFSITVVLTLALGIGANSAVFSAINAVLLRPLPFPGSDRIVSVAQIHAKTPQAQIAPVRLEDWNRMNHTFQSISGYYTQDDSELPGDLPERLTLTAHLSDAYAENRLRTVLLTFFALTAISLACVGLYGTLSYLVNIRQREVGLRLALGARRVQIVRQFLAQGMRVSLLGCAAGLGLAGAFTKAIAGMLFGVSPWDAITMAGVIGLVMAVSIAASLFPAVRAARLDAMQVLRDE